MWKNIVILVKPQMTVWRMRIACWITRATNTHSQCVKPIAFPLQQWLHERALMLRYTYIGCLCYEIRTFITACIFHPSGMWLLANELYLCSTLTITVAAPSEMFIRVYQTARRHVPHTERPENLIHIVFTTYRHW